MGNQIEYIKTFRRATTLQPGNIVITNIMTPDTSKEMNYIVKQVRPEGSIVYIHCEYYENGATIHKMLSLHDIDYVFIKLLIS